eukprot:7676617-Alexandrium_andersonii.AAC.1
MALVGCLAYAPWGETLSWRCGKTCGANVQPHPATLTRCLLNVTPTASTSHNICTPCRHDQ